MGLLGHAGRLGSADEETALRRAWDLGTAGRPVIVHAKPGPIELMDRFAERDELDRLLGASWLARAVPWWCAVTRGWARACCLTTCRAGPGWRVARLQAWSLRWSLPTAAFTSCARRCWTASAGCRSRSGRAGDGVRVSAGPAPDRFLVGLAVLSLLAEAAEQQPLICIVDDAQWLDRASAQVLAFVARRLLAERVAIVAAARAGSGDDVLAGLPALPVGGLKDSDARALLLANVHGPLDAAVCTQIIAECHGNPLALLELPHTWKGPDLGGGFALPEASRQPVRAGQGRAELRPAPPPIDRRHPAAGAHLRPRSPSATPYCCTVPPRRSASAWRQPPRRRTPGCCGYAGAWSSLTRSSDPPATGRRAR